MAVIRLLRLPEVKHLTGLSRTTIYDMMRRGEFPTSIKLGSKTVAWSSLELERWQERCFRMARKGAA